MRHLRRLSHCLAAGVLAGAALLPLQLLLWPELDAPAARIALFSVAWLSWSTLWLGLAYFLLIELVALAAPFLAAQRGISAGLWAWLAVGVGVLVTGVAWWNYKNTKYLLFAARREALEQAVLAAALFTVVVLALAAARRARRPTLAITLAGYAALFIWLWGLWWACPDEHPWRGAPAPSSHATRPRPILFVVWEGADLGVLLPAMERGDMPFLRLLWGEGSWGQLRTVRPYARAAALTTLATGCLPSEHGIAGRRVYRLDWLQSEPFTLLLEGPWPTPHQLPWRLWERAAAPPPRRASLWHILEGAGTRVGLAGWYMPARATWVVPRLLAADAAPYHTLDNPLRTALAPALARFSAFAPPTREAFAVAASEFRQAATRLQETPVDALVLVSDLLGRLRPLWTSAASDPAGAEVLRQAFRLLDEQLAFLWRTMESDNLTLVVASPYGMAPPASWTRLRHALRGSRHWQVAPSSRADGFVFFAGPQVKKGTRASGARVADVIPTLLYMVDLPIAHDMSGRVLLDVVPDDLAATRPLRLIPSYPNPERVR